MNKYLSALCCSLLILFCTGCHQDLMAQDQDQVQPASERLQVYIPILKNKHVALVANQTSVVRNGSGGFTHLADTLLALDIHLKKVFAPEHGFRGQADAGEAVQDQKDLKTGLPIFSLYGKNKKPSAEQLEGIELLVFDIQDVGARFYTYISTLHYVMEACAEQDIPVIILDRPNPNGHYVDGPILEEGFQSFVGMHPVPVVYGMTIGEYGKMINGEGWLKDGIHCDLQVIELQGYSHDTPYSLPVLPSPNLPNDQSINLYPSICFFEGTPVSCGRGTTMQFQVFGSPELPKEKFGFSFTPKPNFGAKYPKHEGLECHGLDLRAQEPLSHLELKWLLEVYQAWPEKETFFKPFFDKLAGTDHLKAQIAEGLSAEEIRKSWQPGLEAFEKKRSKYLLYD